MKRWERSYQSYLNHRAKMRSKGVGLKRAFTEEEYKIIFEELPGTKEYNPKVKNIAIQVSRSDQTATVKEARRLRDEIQSLQITDKTSEADAALIRELKSKYKTIKSIRSQEYSDEESQRLIKEREARIREHGHEPYLPYQPNALSQIVKQLIGLGYKGDQIDAILYGDDEESEAEAV